jgi:anti-sigma B factor antagonist
MHEPLRLSETDADTDRTTLLVAGELDIATAAQFREAIGGLLGTGCRHGRVDLAEVTFADSSGLGALVWAAHRFDHAGGRLTVANAAGSVASTLKVTGLDKVLAPG